MSRALADRLAVLRGASPPDAALVAAYERVIADLARRPLVGQQQARALALLDERPMTTAALARALALSVTRTASLLAVLAERALVIDSEGEWHRTEAAPILAAGGRPAAARSAVLDALARQPLTRDELVERTGCSLGSVSSALSALRAAGLVDVSGHVWHRRTHRFATPAPVDDGSGAGFVCSRRAATLREQACFDGFREAHLQLDAQSPCWQCPQGATRRLVAAWDLEPTPKRVQAVLEHATKSDNPHLGRVPAWALAELGIPDDDEEELS